MYKYYVKRGKEGERGGAAVLLGLESGSGLLITILHASMVLAVLTRCNTLLPINT